jgi:hypothetical protein
MSKEVLPISSKPERVRVETQTLPYEIASYYEQLQTAICLEEDGIQRLIKKPVLAVLLATHTHLIHLPTYHHSMPSQAKEGKDFSELFQSVQTLLKQFSAAAWNTEHIKGLLGKELFTLYTMVETLVLEKQYDYLLLSERAKTLPALPGANKISLGKPKANQPFSSSH